MASIAISTTQCQTTKASNLVLYGEDESTQIIDYGNGTREMVLDFENGTRNVIMETFQKNNASLLIPENNIDLSVLTGSLSPQEDRYGTVADGFFAEDSVESVDSVSACNAASKTIAIEQEMLLGFTYDLAYFQYEWDQDGKIWFINWYVKIGVTVDIRFGLRLPMNVTVEYPEQFIEGNNYTLYATLQPIDEADYEEFLFHFEANVWAEFGIPGLGNFHKTLWGPDIDESRSFTPPLGSEAALPSLEIDIFDLIKTVVPEFEDVLDAISYWVFTPYLLLEPNFGSDKITATVVTNGDSQVVEGADLLWSAPGQRLNFTIQAGEYNPETNYTKISLTDFKYYFTELTVDFELFFDLSPVLEGWPLYLRDPDPIRIVTLDLSQLLEWLGSIYLPAHRGYPGSVSITLYVDRVISRTEELEPVDITLLYGIVSPDTVFVGQTTNVTVIAANFGNTTESFDIILTCDNLTIETLIVNELAANENLTLTFSWDTTGLSPCKQYAIYAETSRIEHEIDSEDNFLLVGNLKTRIPVDFNDDAAVDIYDAVIASKAFGSSPGESAWNHLADLNEDSLVDIFDIILLTNQFGKFC